MTSRGYVKRMPLDEFAAQGRGTRGKAAMSNRAGGDGDGSADAVSAFFACYQVSARPHPTCVRRHGGTRPAAHPLASGAAACALARLALART